MRGFGRERVFENFFGDWWRDCGGVFGRRKFYEFFFSLKCGIEKIEGLEYFVIISIILYILLFDLIISCGNFHQRNLSGIYKKKLCPNFD